MKIGSKIVWKAYGKNLAEIASDETYSIHHTNRGYTAWSRMPMKRIGWSYATADLAKNACETHNRERYGVTA